MRALDYKRIILIVAVVLAMTATWAVAHAWLGHPDRFTSLVVMLWPALMFVCSSAIVAVAFMLQEHAWDRMAGILASWATFILFWSPDIWYLSVLPVFVLLWWTAARSIRSDLVGRQKLRVSTILGHGMKRILLGSFLMVSLGFYLLPSSQRITVASVSRDAQQSVQSTYDNPLIEQQFSQLPAGAQSQFEREVAQYIDRTVRAWLGPVKEWIPPILAFGLFLVLWSFNSLLRLPAIWLGQGLFRLLRWSGFVKIEEKDTKAEILSL